ncbi:MAG: glycosyltransferase [Desulfobacterales bacterium]|nr:glycosyltransferase [Desulfobacterales bacterium]
MNTGSNPCRLVVLLQDLEFGGTQRYALHLLKHLDRNLFSPELWILRGGDDMLPLARETNVRIIHLSRSARVGPFALVHLFCRLLLTRPRILYTLTVVPNIWGRIMGTLVRVPAIVSGYRNLLPRQHEKWLWRLSKRTICNAEILRKIMTRRFSVPPDRIAVIPNAVDPDIFHPVSAPVDAPPTVLFVGRLVTDKDPLNLLAGFDLVQKKIPTARLLILGNGPLKKNLQRAISSRGLSSRVKLIAGTADIRPFLKQATVFTLPAVTGEGSPNVIIEAMATGLPVVATPIGGIPELVDEGRTGLLVKPNDPQALADALSRLLMDQHLRVEMGRRARERVLAHHSLNSMVRRTEAVFLEAAGIN